MTTEARSAWLFDFGAGLRAVAGGRHMVEYLRAPQAVEIPLAPVHARGVLVWRKQWVPLVDLARLVYDSHGDSHGSSEKSRDAIVLAYRETPQSPLRYGALTLAAAPREIEVSNDLACDLPLTPAFWGVLAASCIIYENQPVPILRVRNIFTQSYATSFPAALPDPYPNACD